MSLPLSVYKRLPKRLPLSLGFSRYALNFDGVDDRVEVPDDPSLNVDYVTVEALAYVPSGDSFPIAFKGEQSTGKLYSYRLFGAFGGAWYTGVVVGGKEYWSSGGTWIGAKWYHLAQTYDGEVVKLFVDAKEVIADDRPSGVLDKKVGEPFRIGGDPVGGMWLDGYIALVHLYNRALTEKEIRYNMLNYHKPVINGLVIWLDLEEGMGLKAYDKSGYGNDGDLLPTTNPPTWIRNKMWELRSEIGL